jgi:N utilization substance protein B
VKGVSARSEELDGLIAGRPRELEPGPAGQADAADLARRHVRAGGAAGRPGGDDHLEYVDVAKAFYDQRETGFVNGLLDSLAKDVRT